MKTYIRIIFVLCGLLLTLNAAAQNIGRILVASGEVSLLRQGAVTAAASGLNLQAGDALRTGAAGNAQLWFTDSSIVALRNSSEFRVDQYKFDNQAATDNVVYSLVRGGFRTVAGLIGKDKPDAYTVKMGIASLGRRGTQFGVVLCQDDCNDTDGTRSPNGAYGGIYDGRVAVINNTGEAQFGSGEYFYVSDINSIPQPLLGPPTILADRLTGLAKNAAKPASEPAAAGAASSSATETAVASAVEAPPPAPPVTTFTATDNRTTGGSLAVVPSTTALAGAWAMRESNGGLAPYGGSGIINNSGLGLSGTGATQTAISLVIPQAAGLQASAGAGAIDMVGYNAVADVHWGRWTTPTVTQADPLLATTTQSPPGGFHYLYASTPTDAPTLASKTGTLSYVDVGGTTPTSSTGAIASAFTFGSMNINFTSRTGTLSTVSVTLPNSNWSFTNIPFVINPVAGAAGSGSGAQLTNNGLQNLGSCVGSACGASQGPNTAAVQLDGTFIGRSGNFLAIGFGATSSVNSNNFASRIVIGATRLYQCPTCP